MWHCLFCNDKPRSGHNHTMAKAHAVGGRDCKPCRRIQLKWQQIFNAWGKRIHDGQSAKERNIRGWPWKMDIARDVVALEAYKIEKQRCRDVRNPMRVSAGSSGPSIEIDAITESTKRTAPIFTSSTSTSKQLQASIVTTIGKNNPKAEFALSLAIQKLFSMPLDPEAKRPGRCLVL